MEELIELLREISDKIELTDEYIKEASNSIRFIYSDPNFRHSYAELSFFIEKELYCDERDELVGKLDKILFFLDSNEKDNQSVISKIGKLCDHIQLESIRLNRMAHIEMVADKAKVSNTETAKLLQENKEKAEEIEKSISNTNSQIISVLGIFAGLVITFTVISGLGIESFKHIDELNFYKTIFYLNILGFILYNTVFMMLYIISKISSISIAVKCRKKSCDSCSENHYQINVLRRKYPYVFWMDFFFIMMMIIIPIAKKLL